MDRKSYARNPTEGPRALRTACPVAVVPPLRLMSCLGLGLRPGPSPSIPRPARSIPHCNDTVCPRRWAAAQAHGGDTKPIRRRGGAGHDCREERPWTIAGCRGRHCRQTHEISCAGATTDPALVGRCPPHVAEHVLKVSSEHRQTESRVPIGIPTAVDRDGDDPCRSMNRITARARDEMGRNAVDPRSIPKTAAGDVSRAHPRT